jgi:4-hydroxymandelate oxidase
LSGSAGAEELRYSFEVQPSGGAWRYPDLIAAGMERVRAVGMERYVDLGCESGAQNRRNRDYLESLALRTRILGAVPADITTELFGTRISAPVIASALCSSRVLEALMRGAEDGRAGPLPWDGDYLEAIALGLADAGTIMSTGYITEERLSRVVACGAPVVHIVKPHRDNEWIFAQLRRAEELGCIAVGMDVDSFFGEKAHDEVPGPPELAHKDLEVLRRFIEATSLPFVVKGVLSSEDARLAKELGARAVMVSLHGGESIDHAQPVLQALPEVGPAASGLTLLVDSGFRRGTDVVKALALGAHAAGIATLLVLACAANGRDGVREIVAVLSEELSRTMSYLGCADVASLDASVLVGTGHVSIRR